MENLSITFETNILHYFNLIRNWLKNNKLLLNIEKS
jgi:hypothetical protein